MSSKTLHRSDKILWLVGLMATGMALVVLAVLVIDVVHDGASRLSVNFLLSYPSRNPQAAGIFSALIGSLWVMVVTAILAIPVGVLAGIYLEEYARPNWWTSLVEINIANLAGVPSIIYGLLGLGLFVRTLGLGRSVLAGAATLALLILPTIILTTREALRAVPTDIRHSSYAIGATRWQTIWHQVIPVALPSIMTGIILAMSRAVGETAPLIMIGALTYVAFIPTSLSDPFTVLPIQIFNWVSRPQTAFAQNAAAGIIVLLLLTLLLNSGAIYVRQHWHRKLWK